MEKEEVFLCGVTTYKYKNMKKLFRNVLVRLLIYFV